MKWRQWLGAYCLAFSALASMVTTSTAWAMPPQRIVDGWYAHNATLIMLGAQNQIVGTVAKPAMLPWMFQLIPSLSHAKALQSGNLNAEELLTLRPDLVFVPRAGGSAVGLRRLGLNVAEEGFDSFDGLLACIDSTAELLGTPLAKSRATAYRIAFNRAAASLNHPNTQGPTILHVQSLHPLKVDGEHTIIDQWIRAAGGRNAAIGLSGNMQPVSIEQVMQWNPDIVILGAMAGDPQEIASNDLWNKVAAVQHQRIYRNPAGIFPWDRYSPELLLQIEWAHGIVKNGQIDQQAMVASIRRFYHDFYGIALKSDDAERILSGQPPAQK